MICKYRQNPARFALAKRKNRAGVRELTWPFWQHYAADLAKQFPLRQRRVSRRIWLLSALLVWTVTAGGCERRATLRANTISRERFIATNVALRTLDTAKTNHAEVLKRSRVTEDQLRAFVLAHARDTLLAGVWDEIAKGVEAKRPETEAAASVAPVPQADPAPPEVMRKLPRVVPPRASVRAPIAEKDTAVDGPATPVPDSASPHNGSSAAVHVYRTG